MSKYIVCQVDFTQVPYATDDSCAFGEAVLRAVQ